jgi:hypothetical protein
MLTNDIDAFVFPFTTWPPSFGIEKFTQFNQCESISKLGGKSIWFLQEPNTSSALRYGIVDANLLCLDKLEMVSTRFWGLQFLVAILSLISTLSRSFSNYFAILEWCVVERLHDYLNQVITSCIIKVMLLIDKLL